MTDELDYKQALKPNPKPPKVRDFGSIDTETSGNEANYIDGGVFVDNQFFRFSDPSKLIQFMSSPKYKGYSFFAHNATYDVGVLYKYIKHDHQLLFLNGRIFLAKIYPKKSRRFYIADSLRLSANISLAKLGQAIDLPKLPTPSYLLPDSIRPDKWRCDKHNKLECLECYLSRDCEIVYSYIDLLQKEINRLGGELKNTLASTAMDLFKRSYLDEEYRTPFQERNDFARHAYSGGRVEPFKLGTLHNINIYDINSLYPYVMQNFNYPNPNTLVGPRENQPLSTIMEFEGVSQVSITIPKMHIPPLPFKWNDRLYFPTGKVRSYWTHAEIRKAIELGCTVEHIHWTLYSETICSPFKSYVDDLYNLRLIAKANNDPRELVYKILLNSLYGKFGQRMEAGLEKLVPMQDFLTADNKAGYDFIEFDGYMYGRKSVPMFKQPDYINVLWASYITAYARLTLYDFMMQFPSQVAYCDTDSLFINGNLPITKELGGMKLEHENTSVEIIGPKCYLIFDDETTLKTKVRGVPSKYQQEYLDSHEVTYLRSLGFFEAGKRHLSPSQWVEITKHELAITPKRHYLEMENTSQAYQLSLPLSVSEVLAQK